MTVQVIKENLNDTGKIYNCELVKEYINSYDVLINGNNARFMKEDVKVIKK